MSCKPTRPETRNGGYSYALGAWMVGNEPEPPVSPDAVADLEALKVYGDRDVQKAVVEIERLRAAQGK